MHAVIAIDGPAGSGKTTVSRRVADALGFTLLDTGAIYRALALTAKRRGVSWDDGEALGGLARELAVSFRRDGERNVVLLGDEDVSTAIRTPEMSSGASQVSRHGPVREALLELQRDFARHGPVVAEGRDMATVVFPDAELKVYLDAELDVRARRRFDERIERGESVRFEEVLASAEQRDAADSGRDVAPLRAADGAYHLDTSSMTLDEVVEAVLKAFATEG
ncbi:MAG: (d)CMP kinase [Myxococcales bacterium]|nr:(d)CMP kinase [Myxococcales bacterium]